eukprot:scaffold7202_cov110-Isochrysis_galbana.AAC.8
MAARGSAAAAAAEAPARMASRRSMRDGAPPCSGKARPDTTGSKASTIVAATPMLIGVSPDLWL